MEKKLFRAREGRMLAGVCKGIADYLNLDPTVIRVLWTIVSCFAGVGVVAYIVCAFIMPEQTEY